MKLRNVILVLLAMPVLQFCHPAEQSENKANKPDMQQELWESGISGIISSTFPYKEALMSISEYPIAMIWKQ